MRRLLSNPQAAAAFGDLPLTSGTELRAIREKLRVRNLELSQRLGTTPSAVTNLEKYDRVSDPTATRYVTAVIELAREQIARRETLQAAVLAAANTLDRLGRQA